MTGKTIVIVPTYNEAENICFLVQRIYSLNIQLSVLVVDDNSPDKTYQKVKKLQEKHHSLHLITRDCQQGLGTAYIEGFGYALSRGFDVIIQIDADLSHSPQKIIEMVTLMEKYDLVIGSRYIHGGGVLGWPLSRVLLSKSANIFSKILLAIPLNDLTSGFKCVKRKVLENINFNTILSKGYAFQIEMVYRAFLKGFIIIEQPIVFCGRKKEKSKMSSGIIIEAFFRVVSLALKRRTLFPKSAFIK